ncbi:MAG: hypothetical protein HRT91_03700 [Piscirickettsiaceae bacterium]|nr:hypothetical protein [Piscirickettsiaceae bacterium]
MLANRLLGRPYSISGRISHGNKIGRTMGFPTANIYLCRYTIPIKGVYVALLYGIKGEPVRGVVNLGIRPTFNGRKIMLEVHLFNFSDEIYGKYVRVNFLHKLRDEQNFSDMKQLINQINEDCRQAHAYFT